MGLLREWGSNSPSCKSMSLLPLPPRKSDGRSDPDDLQYNAAGGRILRRKDGEPGGVINLGNMFHAYRQAPRSGRPEALRFFARATLAHARAVPEDYEAARPDLRARLWPLAALEKQRLRGLLGEPGGPDLPAEPVGEHLVATLAYDWPEAVQSLAADNLERWGVTYYEAMEDARRNLHESTLGYAAIGDGFFSFLSGDTYDATRLLLVDRVRTLEVRGRHVAMVPNRDALLITGEDDEAGLAILAELAAKGLEEGYPLSGIPLVLDEDGWADWAPPAGHPLRERFHALRLRWLGPEYAEQKELLDAVHERQGEGVFVASFSAVEKEGGALASYCVWGEGVDTLLPVTDKVAFMTGGHDGPVAMEAWVRVREVAGELMGKRPMNHVWKVARFAATISSAG